MLTLSLSWITFCIRQIKVSAALLYGIQSIPQNFLVDPNGIIIAKNLRDEELTKHLSSLFEEHKN
jgi:hypothetical protein